MIVEKKCNNYHITPVVSVLIPVYNAGEYLRPAVLSIIHQTFKALEIIVIDDGSTDNCINTISDITDHRLKVLRKNNGGKASALNLALKSIQGSFWMIQDADDMSYPKRVEKQLHALQKSPDLAAVFVGIDLIFKGRKFAPIFTKKDKSTCKQDIDNFKSPAHDATGMYRRSMTKDYYFDLDLRIGQGVDYVWRIAEHYPICVIEDCLYSHRVNYDSITHKNPNINFRSINLVIRKACDRRGWNFEKYKISSVPKAVKNKRGMNSILPYALESVISLKMKKKYIRALNTALISASIQPFDYLYYKPLIFFLIPLFLLRKYRFLKARG